MSGSLLAMTQPLTSLLGIEHPILQAGMGHVAYGALAAAVSEAGGLGVIGSGQLSGAELRREIREARSRTDRSFGGDILFARVSGSDSCVVQHTKQVQEHIDITLEERVPVLISGLGNPLEVIDEAHRLGMKVMSVVGNVRQAIELEKAGVDAVIASGQDGGGHVGRVGTFVLIPAVVDAVKIPIVAGGGIADGRGLVAALLLGIQGIWMGTRFIASEEARAHVNYKNKIVACDDEGTVISRAHSGKTVRMIRNRFTEEWKARGSEILPYPMQVQLVGRDASHRGRIEGDVENGALPAGQSVALIHEVLPARRIIEDILLEAAEVCRRFAPPAAVPA
ncbi:nitronate monooxygenase family protein [Reyranella sp.]|uniref:NAD(P)H-dependent flavin oxidoreductase n=1 Tax=Reyranella sp. TaxID=1929291 RepID=UPI0027321AC4|nr:nitronate monooxygenase [Reyranella sp.]MDP2378373.1 nitronate monooxygenase [Reyranella sp.]